MSEWKPILAVAALLAVSACGGIQPHTYCIEGVMYVGTDPRGGLTPAINREGKPMACEAAEKSEQSS